MNAIGFPRHDWSGEVVVVLRCRVDSDVPIIAGSSHAWASPGRHKGYSNPQGALCVETECGLLGVKPAEVDRWRYADGETWFAWVKSAWMPISVRERETGS